MKRRTLHVSRIAFLSIVLLSAFYFGLSSQILARAQSWTPVLDAFPNLTFTEPVSVVYSGDGTNRLFVLEQAGVIKVFEDFQNVSVANIFLDIRDRVLYGGEQGLLGLAFHPNYKQNGYFYVDYVADNPRRTVIARYRVTPSNPNAADRSSELVLLTVEQPFSNHKGGQLTFGADGYLYIGLGDGGSAGDPYGNAQNRSSRLGKILRIDVNSASAGKNYGIPSDNPFVGNTLGYREEIYAYGFRNPWRFSFDPPTERLWVADVGQDREEEIDIVEKGKNYGWNIMEGTLPYASGDQTGLVPPVWEYSHDVGFAIIGGYVYRGPTMTNLLGAYIYGDYGSGRIWALRYDGRDAPSNTLLAESSLPITSFGVDEKNELYFTAFDGKVHKLNPALVPEFPSLAIFALLLIGIFALAVIVKKRKPYLYA